MALRAQYESMDEIPESFRELYEEKEGRVVLSGIEGVASAEELAAKDRALQNARRVERELKGKWDRYAPVLGEREPDDLQSLLDEHDEIKAKLEAIGDEGDVEERAARLADAKLASKLTPLERQLKGERTKAAKLEAQLEEIRAKSVSEAIRGRLRDAATKLGVRPEAHEDVLVRSGAFEMLDDGSIVVRENNGFEPGLDPETWLEDRKKTHPHWWPESRGAGASGGDAKGAGSGGGAGQPKHRNDFKDDAAKSAWMRENGGLDALQKLPKPPQ